MEHFSAREHRNFYRKSFAEQLAVSANADFVYMGFFDCSQSLFVDWWVGHGATAQKDPDPQQVLRLIRAIDRAVSKTGHCPSTISATTLDPRDQPAPPARANWVQSGDYLIGVGGAIDNLVPVMTIVGGKDQDEQARDTVLRIGMAYVTQEMHEKAPYNPPSKGDAIEMALGMLSIHFAVVDSYGKVDYSTDLQADWLKKNGGFELNSGQLSGGTQKTQRMFRNALRLATGPTRLPSILSITTDEGRSKIAVTMPVEKSSPPRALVIFEQGDDDPLLRDHLLKLSGLTNSERRITHHILEGKSLAETAVETNLSLSTVRSYMKGIFAKTSTHRQSELITHFQNAVPRVKYADIAKGDAPEL